MYGEHTVLLVLENLDVSLAVLADLDGLAGAFSVNLPAGDDVAVLAGRHTGLQLLLEIGTVLAVESREAEVAPGEGCRKDRYI